MNYCKPNEPHDRLKTLCDGVYADSFNPGGGYYSLAVCRDPGSGLAAQAFLHGNNIVIAFADAASDLQDAQDKADFASAGSAQERLSAAVPAAFKFYQDVRSRYPNKNIVLTGNGFGASLANIVASKTGCQAVGFEPVETPAEQELPAPGPAQAPLAQDAIMPSAAQPEQPSIVDKLKNEIYGQ